MKRCLSVAAAMVLLSLPAAAAVDWSQARPLTVVASEYQFSPNKLTFERGVPYRLHLENRGTELHEFHAAGFFAAAQIGNPRVLNADRTEVVLPPGAIKDLYVLPRRRGHFRLYCPDHDWAGMTGEIVVK
jgi:uncharacterized cupredoxin-like copper-binding protein